MIYIYKSLINNNIYICKIIILKIPIQRNCLPFLFTLPLYQQNEKTTF
ncbi:MAG: hypothetical protein RLZZ628_1789 [Bacteroidota bacterium]|jgi:hypothetical protein